MSLFGIYAILALSFNLEYGYAGQPNLGKVFFYSVGAYIAGILVAHSVAALTGFRGDLFGAPASSARIAFAEANPGWMAVFFLVALVTAAATGAVLGVLTSWPALRLRGDFLAIVLIAVGEVARVLVRTHDPIAGGVTGIGAVANPFSFLEPATRRLALSLLILAIAGGVYVFVTRLSNSPFGRLLKSVRDDEVAADVMGKETARSKAIVLALGSGIAAIAGVLHAFYFEIVHADDFIPGITFLVVAMVLLGGVANHRGAVVGAGVMTILDHVTSPSFYGIFEIQLNLAFDVNYLRYIVLGLMIILILMFRPEGLLSEQPVATLARRVVPDGPPSEPPPASPPPSPPPP